MKTVLLQRRHGPKQCDYARFKSIDDAAIYVFGKCSAMAAVFVSDLYDAGLSLVSQKNACLLAHQMGKKRLHKRILRHTLLGNQDERGQYVIHPVSQRKRTLAVDLVHNADRTSLLGRKILFYLYQTHEKKH